MKYRSGKAIHLLCCMVLITVVFVLSVGANI